MRPLVSFVALVACSAIALAQTGSLDQVSPFSQTNSASFNGDASSLVWQAQVRAGLAGRLEGVRLRVSGTVGGTLNVRLRSGAGWNTSPVLQDVLLTNPIATQNDVFVDLTAAGLTLAVGDLFVIEMQGTNTGLNLYGSYINPAAGPALYPEPLFLLGPGCFADCGWRIGFETFVLDNPGTSFCGGDGIDPNVTTACPCGNFGSAGHGCANSVNGAGALLTSSGQISNDSVVLHGAGMPGTVSCIYLQGDANDDAVFGDGVRCAGGTLLRLRTRANVGGASSFPDSTDTISLSQRGGVIIGSGAVRLYQTYYRNSAALFCPPETFNVTNGQRIVW